jgi:hypothetical protein
MKNITLVNTDPVLAEEIQNHYQIVDNISENVFIDWYSPKDNIDQITILEEAIKNKSNIVLFDRYLTLKQHEVDWLLRYKNVYLFEPCLITRTHFQYMPFWYKVYDKLDLYEEERQNIGIEHNSNRNNIDNKFNIPICSTYLDVNMTVLFCSKHEYRIGYLPDISNILISKCVPLLPGEHKYYWKLFQGLVINNKKDLEWCLSVLRLYDVLIYGIYDNMEKYFPEMLVGNVVNQITQTLNER